MAILNFKISIGEMILTIFQKAVVLSLSIDNIIFWVKLLLRILHNLMVY
jgi:hypothetical protein